MLQALALIFSILTSVSTAYSQVLTPVEDSKAMRNFLAEVNARVPAKVQAAIKTYKVAFQDKELPTDFCSRDVNLNALVRTDFLGVRKRIYLNRYFQKFLENPQAMFPCKGVTAKQLATKALLFQVASLYDKSDSHWNNSTDQSLIAECENEVSRDRNANLGLRCEYYLKDNHRISGSPSYRNLADYKGQRLHSKNQMPLRLANEHETDSASEHFAINFTEFLTDPQYQCRKPAFQNYFMQLTGVRPFAKESCSPVTHIFTSTGAWKIDIAPEKVYQVHFLYASKGEEMMSRWGHSMLRLVVCAPFRTTVGPECLTDVAFHLVLSYRANIDDVIINYWDGLIGKYPSQLMTFSMPEVIDEYTRGQWRDLVSLPLQLTENQKSVLVQSALEHYWSYAGDYKFLTNNCASETDQLVRASLPKHHIYQDSFAASPKGMYKNLARSRVINLDLLNDKKEAQRKSYYFPSQKESLDRAFENMHEYFSEYTSVGEFASASSAAERRLIYEKLNSFEEIGRAYLLEKYVALVQQRAQQNRITKTLQNNGDSSLVEVIDKLVEASQDRLPWRLASGGYGVPLVSEVQSDDEIQRRLQEGMKWGNQYKDLLLKKFPDVDRELNGIKQNLELLTNRRRL